MAKARAFGATWWGAAWLSALEEQALADPNRLPRGRTYARQDRVQNLQVSPGELRAQVWGSRGEPYSTTLSLRELTAPEWDAVLDLVMSRAGTVAALLAGEVPREIGPHVLPKRGDLGPDCSCPDWADPCKHAAALCYVATDLFDADPFALLTLRGRSRDAILNEVRARRSERLGVEVTRSSDEPRGADPGTSGARAYRREPVPLEQSPTLVARPGSLVPLALEPPADSGIDPDELAALVSDGAERAWAMLAGEAPSHLDLSVGADVVRRAARTDVAAVAESTGLAESELRAAVTAWRLGGLPGYLVHRRTEPIAPERLEPGRIALGEGARVRTGGVSAGAVQLRIDDQDRWWRFAADDELGWLLVDGPADDPTDLL